ncbi:unnamed protein product [Arctia plantaginis]|uniref:Dynein regulatory complex protein 9 n=1 Tax=Arctia plantaginis TaxID=874455 RepID=A0A8S1AMG9_ARCPL|nr:unnamed protein product [Arctia plantaginis]
MSLEEDMVVDFPSDFDYEDEDDYDDCPLFTRESTCRADSKRSPDKQRNDKDNEKKLEESRKWYLIYKTMRGSIHVKETRRRRRSSMVDNVSRLSYFQSNLFATILEDMLQQLHLLGKCNIGLRLLKVQSDMNELLCAKFSVKPSKIKTEIDNIDVKDVDGEQHKLLKLIADRRLCGNVLKETYLDLSLNQSFFQLSKHIKSVLSREQINQKLLEDESTNKIKRRELLRNLRHQRNHMKSSVYETNAFDSSLQREARQRYIDTWQEARCEQHTFGIQNKEAGSSGAIAHYRRKCDEEQRVHSEVEMLANIQLNETLHLIEEVMQKYDKDIEAIDIKLQILKKKLEDQTQTRIEMAQKLVDHEKEIRAWLQFKEERENLRQYRLKMTNAAISVQSWWRGLLVRLELGPYNPRMMKKLEKQKKNKQKQEKQKKK